MQFTFTQKVWLINLILAVLFIFDRLFKKLANVYKNPYIAFGIPLQGRWLIFLITIILLIILLGLIRFYKQKDTWLFTSLGLIFGGALSNLIDRIYSGAVIDYINWWFFSNFNLADAMIVLGAILFAWRLLKPKKSYLTNS